MAEKGLVLNIQRFSLHDGPGIRTMVFLKGCPLRCPWCSNPESQNFSRELGLNGALCLGPKACGACLRACPKGLVTLEAGALAFDRTGCQGCLDCLKACPTGARFVYGKFMSAKEVLKIVESDGQFYRRSGGGLTLSGGEAASQAAFAQELLTEARRRHLGTAMETAGHVPWETLRDLTRHLDQILYDIKHFDEDKHKELTGVGLSTILGNLDRLVESFPNLPITVRTPLIPGLNDSYDDLLKIKALVPKRKNLSWEILPYHRMGEAKYAFLGRQYPLAGIIPDSQHLESLKAAVL